MMCTNARAQQEARPQVDTALAVLNIPGKNRPHSWEKQERKGGGCGRDAIDQAPVKPFTR
jgi:hypothetical protein